MFWCVLPQTAPPLLVEVGAKPPWNQPQVTCCAFSRSPTFWPLITPSAPVVVWFVSEQVSKYGSTSPFIEPSWMALDVAGWLGLVAQAGVRANAPAVSPDITLSAPGVDGPKVVSQSLSLIE